MNRLQRIFELDSERARLARRRDWLIGAMFWSGMTLGIVSGTNMVATLFCWPRMPIWSTLMLTVATVLSLVLFHVNQRQLERALAEFQELAGEEMGL
jgi:hypothetical protein